MVTRGHIRESATSSVYIRGQMTMLPAWINAIASVAAALAAILAWAATKRSAVIADNTLEALQHERADRLAAARAPATNVAQFAEDLLSRSRELVAWSRSSADFGSIFDDWRLMQRRALEAAEEMQPRSQRVNRALLDLHIAAQPMDGILKQIADGIANKADHSNARRDFDEKAGLLESAIANARQHIGESVG
jgi:hypothetical protein